METSDILKGVGAEFELGSVITDFPDDLAGDGFGVDLIPAGAGDFTGIDHQIRADERFTGHTAFGILREAGIKDGVGDLITDFVRMTFRN
jgi:hypothetical protein